MIYFGLREYGLTFRLLYMSLFLFLCVWTLPTYQLQKVPQCSFIAKGRYRRKHGLPMSVTLDKGFSLQLQFANMRKCTLGYKMPLNGSIVQNSVSPLHITHFPRLCNKEVNKKQQSLRGRAPYRRASRERSYGCTVGCYCFLHKPNNAFSH